MLNEFECTEAVVLLTAHRSKGLEYHTVFFLGIHDRQWWALGRGLPEGTATFFVGLSRAAHRLILTTDRTNRAGPIASLFTMLTEAGVPEIDCGQPRIPGPSPPPETTKGPDVRGLPGPCITVSAATSVFTGQCVLIAADAASADGHQYSDTAGDEETCAADEPRAGIGSGAGEGADRGLRCGLVGRIGRRRGVGVRRR
ncbi:3'-5' exonuclease [Streptomyces hygroscopicus]|uniref:3'-5' exonuclease n=1 Tax=Streptomyces hygroscopicus TaxID=1912 RepID=UPI003403AAC8